MSPPNTPPPAVEPKRKRPSKKKRNKNKNKNHPPAVDGADSNAIPTWDSPDSWTARSEQNDHANADTASNASFESNASHRRRRVRGGRKPKQKLQSVSEDGLSPEDQARLQKEQLREAERQLTGAVDEPVALPSASIHDERDEQEDCQGGAELQSETPPRDYYVNGAYESETQPEPQPEAKKFETGVKAFNIRKADPSGGRPMGARIQTRGIGEQPQEQPQQWHRKPRQRHDYSQQQPHQQQQQHQAQQKPEAQHPPQHHQQHIPPLSQTQAPSAQQSQGSESKEVSIKVDLNLEVEILLKAKIKGEVMITFLN